MLHVIYGPLCRIKPVCLLSKVATPCCSVAKSCLTLWPMDCSTPGSPVLHCLPEFAQIHVHGVGDANPTIASSVTPLSFCPPSFPASRSFPMSQLFGQVAKVLELPFSISPSNDYSGLISLRIDWFDLLAVQGTLKNLLKHHSSKASILQHSAFFMVQLSHLYMTTRKSIALTIWTFVDKVMSLLFNMLSMS